MSDYKIIDTKVYSYKAVIGRVFYIRGREIWIVNTTAKHQNKLKEFLKDFIPVKTGIDALNEIPDGTVALEILYNKLLKECNIDNLDSLKRISEIIELPFDERGFIVACKQAEIDELIQRAYREKIRIPRWIKAFNPFAYTQLKTLNSQHKKGGVL